MPRLSGRSTLGDGSRGKATRVSSSTSLVGAHVVPESIWTATSSPCSKMASDEHRSFHPAKGAVSKRPAGIQSDNMSSPKHQGIASHRCECIGGAALGRAFVPQRQERPRRKDHLLCGRRQPDRPALRRNREALRAVSKPSLCSKPRPPRPLVSTAGRPTRSTPPRNPRERSQRASSSPRRARPVVPAVTVWCQKGPVP